MVPAQVTVGMRGYFAAEDENRARRVLRRDSGQNKDIPPTIFEIIGLLDPPPLAGHTHVDWVDVKKMKVPSTGGAHVSSSSTCVCSSIQRPTYIYHQGPGSVGQETARPLFSRSPGCSCDLCLPDLPFSVCVCLCVRKRKMAKKTHRVLGIW